MIERPPPPTRCHQCFRHESRHLLTLPIGFSIARETEEAVVTALATPTEVPRVLIIPQWCVDPPDRYQSERFPSLDLKDLRRRTADGTASLCLARGELDAKTYLGATVIEAAIDEEESTIWVEESRDASAAQSERIRRTRSALALLRSDAVSPVIVVDLWSAPALFLRHIEVSHFRGSQQQGVRCSIWCTRVGRVMRFCNVSKLVA